MQEKNLTNIDEKLYNKIIAVAYNDASLFDKFIVYSRARNNVEIQTLLNEFKETAAAVRSIQSKELPETVVNTVKSRIVKNNRKDFIGNIIYSKLISRPLLSSGLAAIIVIILAAILFFNQPQRTPQYTNAQIKIAEKQLAESLAIVNKVFSKAERQLNKEVIPNIINKNTDKGFNLINDLLIGG
jgi:hypothetical protein